MFGRVLLKTVPLLGRRRAVAQGRAIDRALTLASGAAREVSIQKAIVHGVVVVVVVVVLGVSAMVGGQDLPTSSGARRGQLAEALTVPTAEPVSPAPMAADPGTDDTGSNGLGLEFGVQLVLPIVVTNSVASTVDAVTGTRLDSTDAGFGLGLQFRIGLNLGLGFAADVNFGSSITGMTRKITDGATRVDAGRTLLMGWLGMNLRYAFFNESAVVPFAGVGVALYGVDACNVDGGLCRLDAAFGSTAFAGVMYALSPFMALEVGVQGTMVLPNDTFSDPEAILFPFVGITSTTKSLRPVAGRWTTSG